MPEGNFESAEATEEVTDEQSGKTPLPEETEPKKIVIELDLLKSEQQKIAKELASIEHEIKMHDTTFEQITENLKRALDIVENCGEAYKNASDTIKKLMNQAIFEKFYISNDADMEFKVDAEFKPPFDQILEPVKDDIIRINRLAQDCSSKLWSLYHK